MIINLSDGTTISILTIEYGVWKGITVSEETHWTGKTYLLNRYYLGLWYMVKDGIATEFKEQPQMFLC